MGRRGIAVATAAAVVGLLLAPHASRETTAAWTDGAYFTTEASTSEFFGCQQGPVVVTTLEAAPAGTLTVQGIDGECVGAPMSVEVFDTAVGGVPGVVVHTTSFETGLDGWIPFSDNNVERWNARAHTGSYSLRARDRDQTWEGPAREFGGELTLGESYDASVWVYHESGFDETLTFTFRDAFPGAPDGGFGYTTVATATVPSGTWTQLSGELSVNASSTARRLYVESSNPTMEFYIDDPRVATQPVDPTGAWVEASGAVTGAETTNATDQPFSPVVGTGTMETRVTIGGFEIPSTWEYEAPPVVLGCAVVYAGTLDTVPGIPAGWPWPTTGVTDGFSHQPGYTCADSLPTFSARVGVWAVGSSVFFQLWETPGADIPLCG
ncbi:MAG: hypothetical protein GX593_15040 [Actinomycetales bacterium]|nr:hypothetical protein [Actinomycetales bacterium]